MNAAGCRLASAVFSQNTCVVARQLLGAVLVRVMDDGTRLAGRIVETEAYRPDDAAAHSFRGKTPRNAAMFSRSGMAYVYFVYGMHFCFNVVTEGEGVGAAVLIRALQPLEGVTQMRKHYDRPVAVLCQGPARLCKALHIDRTFDNYDLTQPNGTLWIERGEAIADALVATSPRIGVGGDLIAKTKAWRWFVRGSAFVSRCKQA